MKKTKSDLIPNKVVMNKIFVLRGEKIMLDRDLAVLYDVKSIRLREQVKRNSKRFPASFMFQLTDQEVALMVSQNAIPSKRSLGGSLPYAFTEHGVLMLANVLKSGRALEMSVKIIEIFVKLREMLLNHKDILLKIEKIERQTEGQVEEIKVLFEYIKRLMADKESMDQQANRKRIGFK
jgi:phosphomevalonate kinase